MRYTFCRPVGRFSNDPVQYCPSNPVRLERSERAVERALAKRISPKMQNDHSPFKLLSDGVCLYQAILLSKTITLIPVRLNASDLKKLRQYDT